MNFIIAGEQNTGKTQLARKCLTKGSVLEISIQSTKKNNWVRDLVTKEYDFLIVDECTTSKEDLTLLSFLITLTSVTGRPYYGKDEITVSMPPIVVCIQTSKPFHFDRERPNTLIINISRK